MGGGGGKGISMLGLALSGSIGGNPIEFVLTLVDCAGNGGRAELFATGNGSNGDVLLPLVVDCELDLILSRGIVKGGCCGNGCSGGRPTEPPG